MARYKVIDTSPRFIAMDLQRQPAAAKRNCAAARALARSVVSPLETFEPE